MSGWFGESWGAPCCEPDEHVATPIGQSCLWCRELILDGHQGFVIPCVERDHTVTLRAEHLDCRLRKILPHGPDCPSCRGKERDDHAPRCAYRMGEGDCNCVALEDL